MKDKNLVQIIRFFDEEAESRYISPLEKYRIRLLKDSKTAYATCRKRADILLRTMDNDELNDLYIIVKTGRFSKYRSNDAAWKQAKRQYAFGDIASWRKHLGEKRVSNDACIEYLRKFDAKIIVDSIYSYLRLYPSSIRSKALLEQANIARITTRMNKSKKIETR